jgi:hypothetical protein
MATDTHPATASQQTPTMRVLVAFEDVRFAYSRAIARAIRQLRPGLEVRSVVLDELERELVRFDPHEGPPLKELLEVLDETHERLREGTLSEAC